MLRLVLALLLACPPLLQAEIESEIPVGIEAVTGIRSGYVHRGVELADTLFDFQVETEISLGEALFLNTGGWVASESGGDFSETAFFLDLRRDLTDALTVGTSVTWRDYDNALLRDGVDTGIFATYYADDDLDFTLGLYRDFGNDAWYAKAEAGWSTRLGEDSWFALTGGISWADNFAGRSGMNDFYGRASVTYNVNRTVSLTPFVGWSLLLDDDDVDGDEFFGGLWFEVVF